MFRWFVKLIVTVVVIFLGPAMVAPLSGSTTVDPTALTGVATAACRHWGVCYADLGIPVTLAGGSTGYIFGDTGLEPPDEASQTGRMRSPVMLRSNVLPDNTTRIAFDSAAGIAGDGHAPELLPNQHDTSGQGEFTVIPNDAVSLPSGEMIMSYQSIRS